MSGMLGLRLMFQTGTLDPLISRDWQVTGSQETMTAPVTSLQLKIIIVCWHPLISFLAVFGK